MTGGRGPWPSSRIFGNFNVSSQNVRTFAVCNDKVFEFYWEISKPGPSYSTGATTPLFGWLTKDGSLNQRLQVQTQGKISLLYMEVYRCKFTYL